MRPRTAPPLTPHAGARRAAFLAMSERNDITRNSILRISDEKTIQLIQDWEREECLWNTNLPHYPNKEERLFALAIIAEKLDLPNFTPEHVTMKFKNLRNSYCQELKKMLLDKTYKPKVFWFSHMDKFLKPHLQKIQKVVPEGKKVPKGKTSRYEIKTEIEIDSDNDQDWSVENSTQSEASCSNSIRIESTYSERCSNCTGENSKQSQAKKRKLSAAQTSLENPENETCSENGERSVVSPAVMNNDENRLSTSVQPTDMSANQVAPQPESQKHDHYDTFSGYIASLLRTLPTKKSLVLQSKIVNMVVTAGIEELSDEDSDC